METRRAIFFFKEELELAEKLPIGVHNCRRPDGGLVVCSGTNKPPNNIRFKDERIVGDCQGPCKGIFRLTKGRWEEKWFWNRIRT